MSKKEELKQQILQLTCEYYEVVKAVIFACGFSTRLSEAINLIFRTISIIDYKNKTTTYR